MISTDTPAAGRRQPYEALPRRVRRRLALLSVLRSLVSVTVLVGVYYLLPLDPRGGFAVGVGLVVGLLVFAVVVTLQAWKIARANHPRLRAMEALATAVPLFLLIFAASYYLLSHGRPQSFSEPLDRTDALYYTVTVFSTVGFGDITPIFAATRIVTMLQMLADLAIFGVVARVIVGAISAGLRRRDTTPDGTTARPADETATGGPTPAG